MTSMIPQVETDEPGRGRRAILRLAFVVGAAAFATFWIWAIFFASKEAVNKIGDRAWAARAEQICTDANAARLDLIDEDWVDDGDSEAVRSYADVIDRATDVIEQMLDDVVAVTPADEKGRAIVPQWEQEYRAYIAARRGLADEMRETGENQPFYEPANEGIPISERLETFAGDNEMPACAPPRDLTG